MELKRRLRSEEGIALPVAVSVMAVVLLLVGVAVAYSVHSTQRSNRDRANARALQAANAGLDTAGFRVNKMLIGGEVQSLPGLVTSTAGLALNCIGVNATASVPVVTATVNNGQPYCPVTNWEQVDMEGGATYGEQFQYFLNYEVSASPATSLDLTDASNVLKLKINVVSVGKANGVQRSVKGTFGLSPGAGTALNLGNLTSPSKILNLLSLFKMTAYAECGGSVSVTSPAANC